MKLFQVSGHRPHDGPPCHQQLGRPPLGDTLRRSSDDQDHRACASATVKVAVRRCWKSWLCGLLLSCVANAQSGECGDPNHLYIEYRITGGESLQLTRDGPSREYTGVWRQRRATVEGTARLVLPPNHVTNGSIAATIGGMGLKGQEFRWPGPGESREIAGGATGAVVEKSFSLSMDFPADYTGPMSLTASAAMVNGSSELVGASVWLTPDLSAAASPLATATPSPAPAQGPAEAPASWTVVVGGMAAVLAAAAGLATVARRALRGTQARLPYILQVSQDRMTLKPGERARLSVAAFRVTPGGAPLPAIDAELSTLSGLMLSPSHGRGSMEITVTAPGQPGDYDIEISARGGDGQATARVAVVVGQVTLESWVLGRKEATLTRENDPPEILAFFHLGDEVPLSPSFPYDLSVEIRPAGPLIEKELFQHAPHQYTLKLAWASQDRLLDQPVQVHLVARAEQNDYRATVRLLPPAQASWRIYGCAEDPDRPQERTVEGVALDELEFVADGSDTLSLMARLEPALPADLRAARLEGPEASEFLLEPDPAQTESQRGRFAFHLRSRRPLRANPDVAPANPRRLILALAARPRGDDKDLNGSVQLKPEYLRFSFAVVPGWRPHTSEAAAVFTLPHHSGASWPGVKARLVISAPTLSTSDPLEKEARDAVRPAGRARGTGRPQPIGHCASWLLEYSGWGWDSKVEVRCGPAGSSEIWGDSTIDMSKNVTSLLTDLLRSRDQLKLANPYITYDEERGLAYAGEWLCSALVPEFLSGPLVNVYQGLSGNEQLKTYVCGQYSARIMDWLARRRFRGSPAEMARMNGIEINQYQFAFKPFSHHTAGLHPCGVKPTADPRFLDPWWRQDWELSKYETLEGLPTWNGEMLWISGTLASVALVALMLAKLLAPAAAIAWWTRGLSGKTVGGTALGGATWGLDGQNVNIDGGEYVVEGGRRNVGDWKASLLSSQPLPAEFETFPERR